LHRLGRPFEEADVPRYFFDVFDGRAHPDGIGQECASVAEAREEAMHTLPQIAAPHIPHGGDDQIFRVTVRDEGHRIVYTASLTVHAELA
jgi:hypothetical protein